MLGIAVRKGVKSGHIQAEPDGTIDIDKGDNQWDRARVEHNRLNHIGLENQVSGELSERPISKKLWTVCPSRLRFSALCL